MFILRTITGDGHEINQCLGESYNIVLKEQHPDDFKEGQLKEWAETFPEIYGAIFYAGGSEIRPLYKKQWNYIMTESGKTFANISYK